MKLLKLYFLDYYNEGFIAFLKSLKFYIRNAFFGFTEEWSSLSNAIAQISLYPFFIWIFASLWMGLSGIENTFNFHKLIVYIGLTQILFLTTLRGNLVDDAATNFLLTLTKPRSWLIYVGTLIFGRQLGRRLILLLVFILIVPVLSHDIDLTLKSAFKFLTLLPVLCIIETLYSLIFSCLQLCMNEIKYFRLAITKIFMVFGGVFTPLNDLSYPYSKILINTPIADIIFQPCYYCLTGHFFEITISLWLFRVGLQIIFCLLIVQLLFIVTKSHQQSFGG